MLQLDQWQQAAHWVLQHLLTILSTLFSLVWPMSHYGRTLRLAGELERLNLESKQIKVNLEQLAKRYRAQVAELEQQRTELQERRQKILKQLASTDRSSDEEELEQQQVKLAKLPEVIKSNEELKVVNQFNTKRLARWFDRQFSTPNKSTTVCVTALPVPTERSLSRCKSATNAILTTSANVTTVSTAPTAQVKPQKPLENKVVSSKKEEKPEVTTEDTSTTPAIIRKGSKKIRIKRQNSGSSESSSPDEKQGEDMKPEIKSSSKLQSIDKPKEEAKVSQDVTKSSSSSNLLGKWRVNEYMDSLVDSTIRDFRANQSQNSIIELYREPEWRPVIDDLKRHYKLFCYLH